MRKVSVVALLAAGVAVVFWLKTSYSRAPEKPRTETVAVDRGSLSARVTATGTLAPLKTVLVGSQVSGRLAEIHVDFNSTVKAGQVIARLDPQLFVAAVAQARANLEGARAGLQRAQALAKDATRQHERSRTLAQRELVAVSEAETLESSAEAASAQVVAARGEVSKALAALEQAELNMSYATIKSPIDGIVISRDVDVGQTVAASLQAPTLFTIAEDLRKMQVNTSISESDVGKIRAGMDATFTVDAFPNKRFDGKVREVRNAAKTVQNVVTYDAIIDVANPEQELRPGMTANVTVVHGERDDVLRVPNAALRFRPPATWRRDGDKVGLGGKGEPGTKGDQAGKGGRGMGAGGPPADSRLVWRIEGTEPQPLRIKVGLTDGTMTEILEGDVKPGDQLVTEVASPPGQGPPGGMGGPGGTGRPGGGGHGGGRRMGL